MDGGDTYTHFNRDELRGQMRSMRVLEQLLKRSGTEDLPAMTWTVTRYAVVGEITATLGRTPSACREAFLVWASALGATWREHQRSDKTELRGSAKMPAPGAPHLEVNIGLAAIWWDSDK